MVKYMKFFGWSQIAIILGFAWRTSHSSHSSLGRKSLRIMDWCFFYSYYIIILLSSPPGDTVDNVLLCAVRTRRTNQVDLNSHIHHCNKQVLWKKKWCHDRKLQHRHHGDLIVLPGMVILVHFKHHLLLIIEKVTMRMRRERRYEGIGSNPDDQIEKGFRDYLLLVTKSTRCWDKRFGWIKARRNGLSHSKTKQEPGGRASW